MNLTPLVRRFFAHRVRTIQSYPEQGEMLQRQVLARLIRQAARTAYGERYDFTSITSYESFAQRVPLNDYESLKTDIDRMRHGESSILWPGKVRWYAKASGTTNDKSKFIPVSNQGLQQLHYAGGRDSVALYLRNNPESRLFTGKSLILGGSHQPNYDSTTSRVGDLSAILNENASPFVRLFRVPSKRVALLEDFEQKRDLIAQETLHANVTSIAGVPSWMMAVLMRLMEISGAKDLTEVWPNLEVFFHGGVAFTPYREQYLRLIPSDKMHYMETYNASEGFFGLQTNPADKSMEFMLDSKKLAATIPPFSPFGKWNQVATMPSSSPPLVVFGATKSATLCASPKCAPGNSSSLAAPRASSMPLVKNSWWTMPNKASKLPAKPREQK